ncbi:hypothetical protein G5B47_13230 [Paenibacillus sp. 7124]|uniref:Uncharacterized protein n=1 Tax=Paenibacillus apii TaxID=1850370 RepID=A0A6M1PIV9_9BACL|nr:hypothetical protein [Paenibacillus apii]NGM83379.1 hypothetical protein [Paenibacillus apii]
MKIEAKQRSLQGWQKVLKPILSCCKVILASGNAQQTAEGVNESWEKKLMQPTL